MAGFPCNEDVEVGGMESGNGCDTKGVASAFYIGRKRIDKDVMNATPATYVNAAVNGCVLLDWAFTGPERFKRIGFDIENSFYESDQADENADVWTHLITNLLKGLSPEQTLALKKMSAQCGGLIVQIFTLSCESRVFGIEWNGRAGRFDWYLEGMKRGRTKETHGKFGQDDKNRLEFDFVGRSCGPAMWWKDGDEQDFVTNYT